MTDQARGAVTADAARVAVTGVGCRMPGARDHRELFANLCRGVSSITEMDPERWDPADFYSPDIADPNKSVSKWCGQIDEPYGFDDRFFRVAPKVAKVMDPQQRLLLEETWHCIEDSGTSLRALQQARTVIFVGVAARDHLQQTGSRTNVEAHSTFGGSDYMLANRLSHTFGLRGLSLAVDAACASSGVAIHLGVQALLEQDADYVLAGGVLLNLHPWKYISYSKARMLSPSGLCKTFDKDADGFVPGDGVGIVMLRRLADAVRDGDHIYGLLAGSAANHNGAGRTITAPSVEAQRDVITAALAQAGFDRSTVTYMEAHGTGTALGDPIEVEALHQLMSGTLRADAGCWIGSIKPNIGHLEAAAGVAGLLKVLMMMAERRIPPSIHLTTINPLLKVDDGVLRVARTQTEWTAAATGQPLRAGVSSFGGGGINSHLCVEEYREATEPAADAPVDMPQPFLLSAHSTRSLDLLLGRWRAGMGEDGWIRGSVTDICATLATGREHLAVRMGGVTSCLDDIAAVVEQPQPAGRQAGPSAWALRVGELAVPPPEQVDRLLSSPPFASTLALIEAESPGFGVEVAALRSGADGPADRFVFTYLVVRVLRHLGFQPASTTGYGKGLIPALAAAGALGWSTGMALAKGETAGTDLRAPEVLLVHPATGRNAYPYLVDDGYFRELLDGLHIEAAVAREVVGRAAPIVAGQRVLRRVVDGWNRALDQRGLGDWSIPTDEQILAIDPDGDPRRILVRVLALENAFDQLNREWQLALERLVTDGPAAELVNLLGDGLLRADDLLGLLTGTEAEWAATVDRVQRDVGRLAGVTDARYPALCRRSHMPAGLDTLAGWTSSAGKAREPVAREPVAREPGSGRASDERSPGEAATLTVGITPAPPVGADHLLLADPPSLADQLVTTLLALWVRGVDVDWQRFYEGRRTRKLSLPTTEYVRTVHRHALPPRPAELAQPSPLPQELRGVRLVEMRAGWQVDAPRVTQVEGGTVLVVTPVTLLDEIRPAATAGLAGHRLVFAGLGARYRREASDVWSVRAEEQDWHRLFDELAEQGLRPRYAVRVPGSADAAPDRRAEDGIVVPFLLAKSLLRLRDGTPTLIVDAAFGGPTPGPEPAASVGLGRSLRWESASVRLRSVTMDAAPGDAESWRRIAAELGIAGGSDVVRYEGGQRRAQRFTVVEPEAPGTAGPALRSDGVYLVTGGGGGIGRAVAGHLLSVPGVRVALAGRSLLTKELARDLAGLADAAGDRVAYFPADVADPDSTRALVADVRRRFGPINGVLHGAGVLRDGYLINKTVEDVREVLAPKVHGAANLDLATADEPLDIFVLFSSLVATIGNPGQADYAAANAVMEAFAVDRESRRRSGACRGRTVAIGWPWWDAGGMTVPASADTVFRAENGLAPMPVAAGLAMLDKALHGAAAGRWVLLYGDPDRARPLFDVESGASAPPAPPACGAGEAWGSRYLTTLFSELLGVPEQDVDPARGLDSYGIDSILVRNFNTRVERDLGPIPHTLLFECRTLGQVAAVLASRFPDAERPEEADRPEEPAPELAAVGPPAPEQRRAPGGTPPTDGSGPAPGRDAVAIIGIAGRYPQAPDLDTFWRNLVEGRDCVSEIPASRWDYRDRYTEDPDKGTYCKWGAFLDNVDRFDPLFFHISPREAELIDPQERLFLQTAWEAFEDSGYPPYRLGDPDIAGDRAVGVFVGVTTQSYLLWGPDQWRLGNMVMPTSTLWSIPNRVSYCLDLHGPSMPVDTACASSLTALHLACESLARRECRLALVGAVNLYLHPSKYDWLCQLQMLSRTGRCHTFGEMADGFVPGEGVGAVVIKPLSDAIADGDRILGVIRGTAVNHGGRTSGFTVPNPNAQADVVARAMTTADLDGGGINYLEAHGTGTSLGDPVEIAGLCKAFERLGVRAESDCAIGSVKTSIGHLEAASGIAGLTKILLQMRHRQLVPSLHADPPNPSIDFSATPFRVQRTLTAWARNRRPDGTELPLRAGISAFGAGGSNAHVIVEEFLGPQAVRGGSGAEQLILVSGKDRERLREHCRNLAASIRGCTADINLAEVAYQLQVRREPLVERAAILASTVGEMVEALEAVAADRTPSARRWMTDGASSTGKRELVERSVATEAGNLTDLARSWVAGADVRWESLHARPLRHVSLPSYPFAPERYWIPGADPAVDVEPSSPPQASGQMGHPLLAPGSGERGTFTTRFTGDEYFLEDHRVHGTRIFPAVGYLELAREVGSRTGQRVRGLYNNVWSHPIAVPTPRSVQTELTTTTERGASYVVYSLDPAGERVVHGQGRLEWATEDAAPEPAWLDLAAIRDRCSEALPGADYYPWLHRLGLQLGAAYQGIQTMCWGNGELLTEFRLPEHLAAEADRFVLHPSTLDSALQGALWLSRQHDGLDHLHLPFTMGACTIVGPTPRRGFAHVLVRASSENGKKLDIRVADDAGKVVLEIRDFWLRQWRTDQPAPATHDGSFLQPEWDPVDPAAQAPLGDAGPTLLFAPSAAAGERLAAELARSGSGPTTVVLPGDARVDPGRGNELSPAQEQDLVALLADTGAGRLRRVVYAWPRTTFAGTAADAAAQVDDGLMPLFHLVRTLLRDADKGPVHVLCAYPGHDSAAPGYQALGGFLRTVERESPRIAHRVVELPAGEFSELVAGRGPAAARLVDELGGMPGPPTELRYRAGRRWARRWIRRTPSRVTHSTAVRTNGAYLVTGGCGGLGALVAQWLATEASARIVLVGRSPRDERVESVLARVAAAGGEARYLQADVSTAEGAAAAAQAVRTAYGELNGVFHAAGVVRDSYLVNLTAPQIAEVLAPKVAGTVHLDVATRDEPLDFFCLFSSLAGPIGSAAQAAYAYANSFLDGFADWREQQRGGRRRSGRTISVDWPLWADGGMTVDEEVRQWLWRQLGLRPLGTADGLAALATILDNITGQVAYAPGRGSQLASHLGADADPPAQGADRPPAQGADRPPAQGAAPALIELLAHEVAGIVKLDPARVEPTAQIGGLGFDSLAFNRLANQINQRLGLDLTPATFFEYTTVAELADHLLERFPDELARHLVEPAPEHRQPEPPPAVMAAVSVAAQPPTAAPAREPIAIIGMHGMMPRSQDLGEFWSHLDAGDDLVTEVPADRWDWRDYYSETPGEPDKTHSKWGAFLPEIDKFDARFFGISPREAELMDPQQRLFLQTVYKTIEEAGYAPTDLGQGRTGLFVGVASHDYYDLQREARLPIEAYTTTGYFHSILANRISYLLGLKGPSVPIDAACSSSLVAIRAAIESIWVGSSDMAIAGGINLLISPMIYISFSRAGMLSPSGRCRTFDESADGYVRGEGAGALLLKPLSRALLDGDHIHAVIRGSAVNHGGRVNTLTTPNPNAQADLIVSAFEQAGVDPATVGYMEMHGTGTALGDPIEVNGLKKAFRELRRRAGRPELTGAETLIGSVKSNVGHLEAAAGMAGVFKVILAMRHERVPGNLHIRRLNPHIQLDRSPFRIARASEPWPRPVDGDSGAELPRRAGVSSFGFGGINAHLLIEEHLQPDAPAAAEQGEHLLVLSARTADQLAERVRDLASCIAGPDGRHRTGPGPDITVGDAGDPLLGGIEGELVSAAAGLLGVPARELSAGESLEDLGLGVPRLARLNDWISERFPDAEAVRALPLHTLAGIAATIAAARVPAGRLPLRDLAYTLQVGREHMVHRLALVASSATGAAAALRRFTESGGLATDVYLGQVDPSRRGAAAPAPAPAPEGDLGRLAEHWIAGGEVDWSRWYDGAGLRRLSLPTYPFARVRHWIPAPIGPSAVVQRAPWTADGAPVGDLTSGLVFRMWLAASDPVVGEHRVHGAAVLPGVGHIELVHTALVKAFREPVRLARVVWLRPLAIAEPGTEVLVRLQRRDAGVEYQVQAVDGEELVTFSQGVWEPADAPAEPAPVRSLADLRRRCPRVLDTEALYAHFQAQGVDYGPFFRGLKEVCVGDGEVFATARAADTVTPFTFHPTLMDAALQAIAALDLAGDAAPAPARLPFSVESMQVSGSLSGACHIHVRSRGGDGYDVDLLDESGRELLALREVSVRAQERRLEGFFYAPYWEPQATTADVPVAGQGGCLVVHAPDGFGLARDIAAAQPGERVWTVRLGTRNASLGGSEWEVDTADPDALARCLRQLDPRQVWFLGGLAESERDLSAHLEDPALTLFRLVRALADADRIQDVETLRVLVNGVHNVAGHLPTNPGAASLVGLVKALGKEFPRIRAGCLDIGVPVGGTLTGSARARLLRAALNEPVHHDDEVAWVDGTRYVKRLRPVALPPAARSRFRERGTYVIIGGAGGIGRALARHLATTQRAQLVLVGRRPPDAEIAEELTQLTRLGGAALYLSGDVTDRARLAEILAEAKERFGPICGVVHAAMVLSDGIVERMDAEQFQAALAPKTRGTEVLGELLRGEQLDFLLHLSSVQSFTGAAGQANYAAASTAQDAYARRLAGRGAYPVKVVNWGYWGTVGRVASERYRQTITARGFAPISTAEGMEAIERVLACDEPQIVAVRADADVLASLGVREPARPATDAAVPVPPLVVTDQDEREHRAGEDLIAHLLLRSLRRAGLFPHPGAGHADPGQDLGALPKYRRLVWGLVGILIRHGLVAWRDGLLVATDRASEARAPDGERLRAQYPNLAPRLDLVDACLAGLPRVLGGELSAPEVLFPAGSTELLGRVYRGERLAAYCNRIVAEQVAAGVHERARADPEAEVRVLEIGAGTGSTTEVVLEHLRDSGVRVRYDFSDVSEAFLRQAQRTLDTGPLPIHFRRLDIESPAPAQGFTPGSYQVVLAGNVLHAVADVGTALDHAGQLLVPGGRLVLTEVTQAQAFHTVTFGLLDGWWRHEDGAGRLESSPLLDVSMWRHRLEHAGFTAVQALGTATAPMELSQRVIVARAPVPSPAPTAAAPAPTPARSGVVASEHPPAPRPADRSLEPWLRRLISELIAETLNMSVGDVTPAEPLSSLGVDSIVGVELISRLNSALGITLKTIVVFDHPTVAELASFVLGRHRQAVAARAGDRPATPVTGDGAVAAPDGTGDVTAEVGDVVMDVGDVVVDVGDVVMDVGDMIAEPGGVTAPAMSPSHSGFRAVRFERPGSPQDLTVVDIQPVPPARGEVEIQVRAFPVNFSDLLLAKGLYPIMPEYPFTPGVEVSGVVRRVGPGVSSVQPGDEVIALTRPEMGGQASIVLTDEDFVVHKPASISHEQACGFPAAFLAMYLAFEWAQVRAGERVLIPAATGTNALVAVQLAGLAGAEVIATAGSRRKVDFLTGIGVRDAIDYQRADVVAEVRDRTQGRGVDVVINTLGGQAIQQGLSVLAPEGRYVEIAVFGLQTSGPLDLSRLVDNQRFFSLNAKKFFLQHPDRRASYLSTMASYLESGKVRPYVAHVLPFHRIAEAYTLKEDRGTIGRVVVTVPEPAEQTGPADPPARRRGPGRAADIAVVGMAARFPGAEDVDELWANLAAGVSAIREIPESRWSSTRFFDPDPACLTATYCNRGGFLDDVDRFDAPFFNISGKEAEQTDPQQRLFLEEAWKALEDAGYTGEALNGRSCGVFVGAGASEYLTRMNQAAAVKQAQAFWGNEASILAARISYFLNLKGPSIAVNTACSSSLVALHLACQSLLAGETEMALAGGAFITLTPDYFIVASNGNMLSPEGRCKTFDASADGFGPGEGVGVLVLKPLEQALRDGDQIHGVIRATALNQDGRTNGITAPSGLAQTDVELTAYRRAGVDPATIGYVEAHGTGTPLGDPIEVEALTNAFRTYTDRTGFCRIGSIKTNIGHTAAAAGVAGVIKVLLSFRYGKIPPSLNFEQPNPLIDFEQSPFIVNTQLCDWIREEASPRRAAVSSFGFSGTNAHVVLEEPPRRVGSVPAPRALVAVPVSAHTPTALEARLDRLAAWLEGPGAGYSLPEIGYNLQVFREHRAHRMVFVARDLSDLVRQVRSRTPGGHEGGELSDLTSRYLAGDDVDWRALWAGETSDRIPLPSYTFDRHRYWFVDTDNVYSAPPAPGTGAVPQIRSRPVDAGSNGNATTRTATDDVSDPAGAPVPDRSGTDLRSLLRMLRDGEIGETEVELAMEASGEN